MAYLKCPHCGGIDINIFLGDGILPSDPDWCDYKLEITHLECPDCGFKDVGAVWQDLHNAKEVKE